MIKLPFIFFCNIHTKFYIYIIMNKLLIDVYI